MRFADSSSKDYTAYVNVIVDTIISTGRADDFIIAIANVIQRLAIDQLNLYAIAIEKRFAPKKVTYKGIYSFALSKLIEA